MSQVTTAFKASSSRSAHPQHPVRTAVAADSGTILTARPGQPGVKLTNGAQSGATKEGEVSGDFA